MSDRKLAWFRMYCEAVDDEKLRLLAFEDRWHFVAILCCKAAGIIDEGGPLMRRKVAVKLGLDVATLDEVAKRLASVELIDRETLQPIAWDRRQYASDSSAERTRAYRDRQKRHGDVTVTPPETETDTETDTEDRESAKPSQARSPKGSRLPDNFPGDEELDFCRQHRPDLDPFVVRDKFRDYWLGVPGARGRKLDWPATFRNFVRTERAPPQSMQPRRSAAVEAGLALAGFAKRQPEAIDIHAIELTAPRLG